LYLRMARVNNVDVFNECKARNQTPPGNISQRQRTPASTCCTAKSSRAAQLSLCLKVSMPQVLNQNIKMNTRICN
jgi:hypothetical protein